MLFSNKSLFATIGLMGPLMFSCTQPSHQKTAVLNQVDDSPQSPILSFSFVDLEKAPNGVAPLMTKENIKLILAGYFDLAVNSAAGSEVMGRINYRNNFKFASEGIPKDLSFHLLEGDQVFELKNEYDQYGRLFGKLILKEGQILSLGSQIPLKIELRQNSKVLESSETKVNIVAETLWSQHYAKVRAFALSDDRLSSRYKLRLKSKQIDKLFEDLENHQGRFSDFKFYDLKTDKQRTKLFPKQKLYSKQLVDSAERIAGLAHYL